MRFPDVGKRNKGATKMKVAVSSTGKELTDKVSEVFGRCPYFIIAEIKENKIQGFKVIENTSMNQRGGAGISAAQAVAEKDLNAVISGNIGPRASDVLRQFNIKMYTSTGTVENALKALMDNKLKEI